MDFGGKTSIFSHPVYLFLREFSLQDSRGGSMYGERYSYKGFNEAWRKARNAASEELGRPLDCTFHDLKAKGISDYEGSGRDKQKFSGHKTESQVLVYDRKVKISPTLNKKMR